MRLRSFRARRIALLVSFAALVSPAQARWHNVGPGGGGWIESIRVSDHAPDRMFVGCDVAGVFVSENGGRSYSHGTDGLGHFFIETIAEHPSDPDFLLVGTLGGVYRSCDRGKTWRECRAGFPKASESSHSCPIARILPVPGRSDSFVAARGSPRGMGGASINVPQIYRTDDRGSTWRRVDADGALPSRTRIMDMALATGSPFGLVVSTSDNGIYRSVDGGVRWEPSNTGLPHLKLRHIASAPGSPSVLYAALALSTGRAPWDSGVYRSDDAGMTWRAVNSGLPTRTDPSGNVMKASWTNCLSVDPRDPDTVYVGVNGWTAPGVYKTVDGGASWKCVYPNGRRLGWLRFWGPAVESLSVGSRPPYAVAFGTSGYVMRSEDGGETWRQCYTRELPDGSSASVGLETTVLHKVVPDRFRKGRLFFCYYDIGLVIAEDSGRRFRHSVKGLAYDDSCNCLSLAQVDDSPDVVFATFGQWYGNDGVVARSDDGGESWQCLSSSNGWQRASAYDLAVMDGRSPYAIACRVRGRGIAVSEDGGNGWRYVSEDAFPRVRQTSAFACEAGVLYAGVGTEGGRMPGGVWRSGDRGRTWTQLTASVQDIPDVQEVAVRGSEMLVVARERFMRNERGAYVLRGGAWHSADGGRSWRKVFEERFCSAALFMSDGRWVVATNDHAYHDRYRAKGLFVSADRGKTWSCASDSSMTVPNVTDVAEDPYRNGILWVGTNGGSVFVGAVSAAEEK